jgi:carbamoyl-phosphate synthase small subunit
MKEISSNVAYLVLEDGTIYKGNSMGKRGETIGEVVFNTCTASYQEILNDPTYYGQIVAQTYPLVGNRGMESQANGSSISANGYIAREWCETPSDIQGGTTLDEYLKNNNIVGIWGIDTRQLTRKIRDKAYFKGSITDTLEELEKLIERINAYSVHGAVIETSIEEPEIFDQETSKYTVVVVDFGFPRSMLNNIIGRGCKVIIVPARTKPAEIMAYKPDGIIFPDGPGDPDDDMVIINNIKELLRHRIPSLGIGVGHQMMAIAAGYTIRKMEKGHRGSNQPVRITGTDKVMVTTQNHGYDVLAYDPSETIAEIIMKNVNDDSIEGLAYTAFTGISTQFLPIEVGNYSDTSWIYDDFIVLMEGGRNNA